MVRAANIIKHFTCILCLDNSLLTATGHVHLIHMINVNWIDRKQSILCLAGEARRPESCGPNHRLRQLLANLLPTIEVKLYKIRDRPASASLRQDRPPAVNTANMPFVSLAHAVEHCLDARIIPHTPRWVAARCFGCGPEAQIADSRILTDQVGQELRLLQV